jgi:hypothetical protein
MQESQEKLKDRLDHPEVREKKVSLDVTECLENKD